MKLLSIIVPSYNMEKYLPKCLGSLIVDDAALLQRLDVIVVNDGSKDRTSEIAHEFEAKYPGVFRVIDKPNGNYGSCINAALPTLQGKYVKVLDADDWFETESFTVYLNELAKIEGVELVLTDFNRVDCYGSLIEARRCGFPERVAFPIDDFLHVGIALSMHAFTYRSSIFSTLSYQQLEGVSYTDTEWITFPLLGVSRVLYIPLSVYRYVSGRPGQTMENETVARNWWMLGMIGLDMLKQLSSNSGASGIPVRAEIERRSINFIESSYRSGIYGCKSGDEQRLIDFDRAVKQVSTDLYDQLGKITYSRFMRYRFVRSWRERAAFRPLLLAFCKWSTTIGNRLRTH